MYTSLEGDGKKMDEGANIEAKNPERSETLGKLGSRLRKLRSGHGLSVRTLAARTGFSPSFISQLEADSVSPSLASLEKIAAELGTTLGQLFSSLEESPQLVIRRSERPTYESAWSKSTVEVVSEAAGGRLSAVTVSMRPGGASSASPQQSPHETFALVLEGELCVEADGQSYTLAAGDAATLPEGIAFRWENQSTQTGSLLIVVAEGASKPLARLLRAVGAAR